MTLPFRIRKAVIAAAGLGTRFLPFSKAQPKEMLPVVDTPVIQYVVEEAVDAGISDIVVIISNHKPTIQEHFSRNAVLERELEKRGRLAELKEVRRLSELANLTFVMQPAPKGLGDAVFCAKPHVGREPFVLLLGDSLIKSRTPLLPRLANIYDKYKAAVIAVENVERSQVENYGIITGVPVDADLYQIQDIVEKPRPHKARSRLAIAARYAFPPEIFDYIERTPPAKNGEHQLTDAIRRMLKERPVFGATFEGRRYDVGNKLDFLKTNIEFGLAHATLGDQLGKYIQALARKLPD